MIHTYFLVHISTIINRAKAQRGAVHQIRITLYRIMAKQFFF